MGKLLDRWFGALGFEGPLSRQDRPLWESARTIDRLAALTARWLEGGIASQPGYYGPVDVDEDLAPGLTETLITLNRAGYLTNNSQAGYVGEGYDGAQWQQLASVTGFAEPSTCEWLTTAVTRAGFEIIAWPCAARRRTRWCRSVGGVTVTWRDGEPITGFGDRLSVDTISGEMYGGCHPDAVQAVCAAMQVTIYDPAPGFNDLWAALRRAVA